MLSGAAVGGSMEAGEDVFDSIMTAIDVIEFLYRPFLKNQTPKATPRSMIAQGEEIAAPQSLLVTLGCCSGVLHSRIVLCRVLCRAGVMECLQNGTKKV